MSNPVCKVCGAKMMRNGRTSAGTQRWRCGSCGSSSVRKIDSTAKWLKAFVSWLLGKPSQAELKIPARTFREKTSRFWKLWPILPICDEIHHVVFMDGIWLIRNKAILLIACTEDHVIGCHLAKTENSVDWGFLMQRIAPPDVLVCDGGGGIAKAMRAWWPNTHMQRCTFHAYEQVRRCTTYRPKTQAGVELYGIAHDLMHIKTQQESAEWLVRFHNWCTTWHEFLKERTVIDGKKRYKHERLRKARRGLESLCREGTLFTYLEDDIVAAGPVPSMSNKIENMNGQIRQMLRLHRGMNIDHRIKAIFWYCYMNSEAPKAFAGLLRSLPTDDDVSEWRRQAALANGDDSGAPARWGNGIVWSEFHNQTPYPYSID